MRTSVAPTGARRGVLGLAVFSLVLVGALFLLPAATSASTPNTQRYSASSTFVSTELAVCVDVRVSGTFTDNATRAVTARGVQTTLTSIQLIDPIVRAAVHVWTAGSGCTQTSAKVDRISLRQRWSGQAPLATHYGSGAEFTQYNTGSPLAFPNQVAVLDAPTTCFGVAITAAYQGNASNPQPTGFGRAVKRVCLTPTY